MTNQQLKDFVAQVIQNMPSDWLKLTTHRLDIYDESRAKFQFLDRLNQLYTSSNPNKEQLAELPTAYDYIRLGHPLSSVLEWALAVELNLPPKQLISFSSKTTPILAILRKNLMLDKPTKIYFEGAIPDYFQTETIKATYGYNFSVETIEDPTTIIENEASVIYVNHTETFGDVQLLDQVDFYLEAHSVVGSLLYVNGIQNADYVNEIQHVRRRETIAMTPSNCLDVLKNIIGEPEIPQTSDKASNKKIIQATIQTITESKTPAVIGSSGLSIQYAIVMGLIDYANENHPGKAIKIVVPPNCYGGTNDQARRVAACLQHVEVMDLPVDGDNDMVQSTENVLHKIAQEDAVPFIIAEIPTNPRVEVPDLQKLRDALHKTRTTSTGETAIAPVFILDQTFCPNVHFLGDEQILSSVQTISYVSGSKFPSGGLCTAGYCVANDKAAHLMPKIDQHLQLCDNEATQFQMEALALQMPSMLNRISAAYTNTRKFVNFIQEELPASKINFVSEELAEQTFTPSVFSLDLPTKGSNDKERENYKRELNLKLINKMINEIPNESKYCVSYGQLKGCYWTIPATSTQGTTKEGDKDYIVRVALSGEMDLEKHKAVFKQFVEEYNL